MKTLEYFFDFSSPYSFFSWMQLKEFSQDSPIPLTIQYYPVILGRVLGHWGIKGPAEVSTKRNYLFKHCLRYAKRYNIPFRPPAVLPFNSLYSLRLAVAENAGPLQATIIDAIWKGGWQEGRDLGSPEDLVMILNEVGLPGNELMDKTFSRQTREALKSNTQFAISRGVFGVPTFVVDQELFWGNDSINDLKDYLIGRDSLDLRIFEDFLHKFPT